MPFFDSREDYRYCTGCGAELEERTEPTNRFDTDSGDRIMRRFLRCPNRKGLLGPFKHADIEPHYWGSLPPAPAEE